MMLMYGNDMESAANEWQTRTERDNSTGVSMGLGSDDDLLAELTVAGDLTVSCPSCHATLSFQSEDFAFDVDFALWSIDGAVRPIEVVVPDDATHVRTLTLQETVDTGGMLYVQLQLMTEEVRAWTQNQNTA
ncbi:hypothetical protein C0Q70_16151 [Pomacea canaliculata]|uniref:Uncharacterized protein n=1 Tax=Pomacea canaliculata TaxID=400727 RepID=A0A2T7NP14_POMCA|nr:hypothetical protein C0Q70_16151 [Pomacea canaliculata]